MANRSNPFRSVYDSCNSGDSSAKLANLPPFPRYIDIETSNHCNFKCLMCPTGTGTMRRTRGFMSNSIFDRIVEGVAAHKTPVRFIRWGEPFLHPEILRFMRELKEKGCLIHANTNGSLWDDERIQAILDVGLDSLKVSFQGVDQKSFAEMRNRDFFEGLVDFVTRFHKLRGSRSHPFFHVSTTITYETPEQVAEFQRRLSPFVDLLSVGRTVLEHIRVEDVRLSPAEKDMLIKLQAEESVVKQHPECPEVFDKLSINWDGKVVACCSDYDEKMVIGDISEQSIEEIWNGSAMMRYREMLAQMRHDELDLCKTCYDYHGLQTPGLQEASHRSQASG